MGFIFTLRCFRWIWCCSSRWSWFCLLLCYWLSIINFLIEPHQFVAHIWQKKLIYFVQLFAISTIVRQKVMRNVFFYLINANATSTFKLKPTRFKIEGTFFPTTFDICHRQSRSSVPFIYFIISLIEAAPHYSRMTFVSIAISDFQKLTLVWIYVKADLIVFWPTSSYWAQLKRLSASSLWFFLFN